MSEKASILLLPVEIQTQILSYLLCLDQMHCMSICPLWCTILQQDNFSGVRYYDHIYPGTHRLVFEQDIEIDLRVINGAIKKASIWKRPAAFKEKPEYLLANIDLNSEQPSILNEALFRDDFSRFAPDKVDKIRTCLLDVILCVLSGSQRPDSTNILWKKQWIMSECPEDGFEGMTIIKFLDFMKNVVAVNESLGTESLVTVKFSVVGWRTRRLAVLLSIKERTG